MRGRRAGAAEAAAARRRLAQGIVDQLGQLRARLEVSGTVSGCPIRAAATVTADLAWRRAGPAARPAASGSVDPARQPASGSRAAGLVRSLTDGPGRAAGGLSVCP